MGGLSQVQLESQVPSSVNRGHPILEVRDLVVTFRKTTGFFGRSYSTITAVDNFSFDLYEREFISLVGESGSGKTTIARCLLLLNRPVSGSIKYNGEDVLALKGKKLLDYRREVQIIYQDPFESLNPRQDVYTTLTKPIHLLTGEKNSEILKKNAASLLEEVGLNPTLVLHKYPHQLSGGERQRINIARALAPKPKLLIADEPITMLDATQRFNILSLLMKLKSTRNLTVMMITHDLASAKLVSERIMIIYLGKLVETGATRDIISKPHHPYVELIMNSVPRTGWLSERSTETESSIEESMGIRRGCVFSPRCKYATDICRVTEPPLEQKSPRHYSACHNPTNV